MVDAIIAAFEICAGAAFDEDEARAAAEDVVECEDAVATTEDFDTCIEELSDPTCVGRSPTVPDSCDGGVLIAE